MSTATVAEPRCCPLLWKGKPVIGGACGGITLQVYDHYAGLLAHSMAGAAYRIRYLRRYGDKCQCMGQTAHALPASIFCSQPARLLDHAVVPVTP